MKKVFIDGSAGTTGLRIHERLSQRNDVTLLFIPDELRKDAETKKRIINEADVVFLCLPDDAARESVALVENANTVVIDASTAHRTLPDWAYGFAQLSPAHKQKILNSKRIAVPGCHASGFIALVYPLISAGLLKKETLLSCHSLTGYSGGGKKMIADYQAEERNVLLDAPRVYALGQTHKHLKEMQAITGLGNAPHFSPIVGDFYSGMLVSVPVFGQWLNGGMEDVKKVYRETYHDEIVQYQDSLDENGFLSAVTLGGKDGMRVTVVGNDERMTLMAAYDNLGKGASGAAVECMNLVIGAEQTKGLQL